MGFQKCPVCDGSGVVPPSTYHLGVTQMMCDVCQGKKVISSLTGRPPGDIRCVSGDSAKETKVGDKKQLIDLGTQLDKNKCFEFYKYAEAGYIKVGNMWEVRNKMSTVEQRLTLQDIYELWVGDLKSER